MISQEYIAAIVIVIVSALHAFGVEVANNVVETAVAGLAALWIIARKIYKGEINVLGVKQ